MKKALGLSFVLGLTVLAHGQDSLSEKTMEGVTVAANKRPQNLNEVPNKITKITRAQIIHNNPQTAADLLAQSGTVFMQKSQLGGGSPMIRGFATNRVLLVMDGVRMNNAIYRSGNLQNVISIDALSTETAEVIFGPGSLIYGSDAIGGVMDFRTLQPHFSTDSKNLVKGSALTRYSTANDEKTIHADLNIGDQNLSFLGSFTYSDFGDLKMGEHGGQDSYLRPEYVERINNVDVIVKNADPRVQRFSGYTQTNFLGKLRYKPTDFLDLQYSFTHAKTGTAPRYDRLIQYRNGALRFAEWNYGPMLWNMHSLQATINKPSALADAITLTTAYQEYEESRIDRARGNNNRTTQAEAVEAFSVNVDVTKGLGKGELFYGAEYVHNEVGSTGMRTDISTGTITPFTSRYPDGSTWSSAGIYGSYKINVHQKLTLTTGLRYSYNNLDATFDTTFVRFPYQKASIQDGALTGNAAVVYRPAATWQLSANVSTGYRMPNVDDIGKLFESAPGIIIVPSPELKPEYAWNFEAGIAKEVAQKFMVELNAFHTVLTDAIVRRPFTFNGSSEIDFDGTMSQVEALQNVAKATVWGIQAGARVYIAKDLFVQSNANWINGKETDDAKDEQVALRHAPPFYGSTHLHYKKSKWHLEAYAIYNSKVSNEDLAPSEQAKTDIYAKDEEGRPYSPSWTTVNLKASYKLNPYLLVSTG
ncbi:MAG TPA: TonB-dependent receptor, partial [Flavisolibacter sp.]|nr:TonB-dependent receptor [Flavisolibacter sp.]